MGKANYPLQQVYEIKQDRVQKAEKLVEEKKQALLREEEKLKKVEKERDTVKKHYDDKVLQLRQSFDEGTTSEGILQKKTYIKVVEVKLLAEEKKVQEQKNQVKVALKNLEEAKEQLKARRLEEEKIKLHKELWEKEEKARVAHEESKEQEEIGQAMYEGNKRRKGE